MKTTILLALILVITSCSNTDKDVYNIETTLLDGTIDTLNIEVHYNKELREMENNFIKSDMFNEQGINTAYALALTHPLGVFYKDTLSSLKPSLIQFSKIAKNYTEPLGAKLIDNSLVFNRSLLVDKHAGQIQSFNVLSKTNTKLNVATGLLDQKLLQFVNSPTTTAELLDKIPYVTTKASINIVNARPIKSAYELNKIPYVTDEAVKRIRIYAENN